MERPGSIQKHLRVVVNINKHTPSCLEINHVQKTFSFLIQPKDKKVRSAEAGGSYVGIIHTFFHQHQGISTVLLPVLLHRFNNAHSEFVINIGDLFDLLRIKLFRLRACHPSVQVPPQLVFTQGVGERTLFRINAAFIWKSLLQPY